MGLTIIEEIRELEGKKLSEARPETIIHPLFPEMRKSDC